MPLEWGQACYCALCSLCLHVTVVPLFTLFSFFFSLKQHVYLLSWVKNWEMPNSLYIRRSSLGVACNFVLEYRVNLGVTIPFFFFFLLLAPATWKKKDRSYHVELNISNYIYMYVCVCVCMYVCQIIVKIACVYIASLAIPGGCVRWNSIYDNKILFICEICI